jgi:FlaA1/EpsC-like NDP-sugar epimerase
MRNRYVLLADVCLIPIVAFAAFALRFDLRFYTVHSEFPSYVVAGVLIKPIVFYGFGMYRRYWQYASVKDLIAVLLAASASLVAMGVFVTYRLIGNQLFEFSRAVLVLDGILTFLMAAGVRLTVRAVGESRGRTRESHGTTVAKRVLVVGAGQAGTLVVREMERNSHLGMTPVGFLDDERVKKAKQIHGVPVIGPIDRLASVVQ